MLEGQWEGKLHRARQGNRFDRDEVGVFILQTLTKKFHTMGEPLANSEDLAMELYPKCQLAFLDEKADFGVGAMVNYINRAAENYLVDYRRTPKRVLSKRLWHAIHEKGAWLCYRESGGLRFVTLRIGAPSGTVEQLDEVRQRFSEYKIAPQGWLDLAASEQKLVRAVTKSLINFFGAAIERDCLLSMLVDLIPVESHKEISMDELITEPVCEAEAEELASLPDGCWERMLQEKPVARTSFLCRLDHEMVHVLAPEPPKPNWCNAVSEALKKPDDVYEKLALSDEDIGRELAMTAGGVKTMRFRFLAKIRLSLEHALGGNSNLGLALS